MTRPVASTLALLGALCTAGIASEPVDATARLIALAKLWATVKHFHPGIDESKPGWWDEALLVAVPAVEAASSRTDYAAALNAMLARLRDPVTRVEDDAPEPNALAYGFAQAELRNGVLLVTGGPVPGDPLETAQPLRKLLPHAQAIVFDLRRGPVHPWLWRNAFVPAASIPLSLPAHRFRVHVGNVTPRGAQDVAFFSGHVTRSAPASEVGPGGGHERVVFVVSDSTQVPLLAVALQVAGSGYVVAERPIDDRAIARHGMAQHYRLPVGEGLVAHVRTSLMVHRDATTGLRADRVTESTALDIALQAAAGVIPHALRPPAPPQYEVRAPEEPYTDPAYPSWPLRVLAAIRVWATFEWLNPYRDLMDGDWEDELRNALVRLRDTEDEQAYHLAIAEMVAHVGDTHSGVGSAVLTRFWGPAAPGVTLRPVEGRPVVVRLTDPSAAAAGIALGDVVLSVDGVRAEQRLAEISRYIAASTPQALERDATHGLLRGQDGSAAELVIGTADRTGRRVTLPRRAAYLSHVWETDSREAYEILPSGFGYMDLRRLMPHQVDAAFDALQATKGLIFDMRGYPNATQGVIAGRLTNEPMELTMPLWVPLLVEPGAVTRHEFLPNWRIVPREPTYRGKTVMLIDDRAQSQSENTALVLRAVHGTMFVGSPTAGANGEGSNFVVPGGLSVGMTGVGVSHPDGTKLQRIGILPDISVHPTIDGIRAGRDEVLERAVRYLEDATNRKN